MVKTEVIHYNKIGHEINISLSGYPSSDREVYCKRLHKVTEPMENDCVNCPYFSGLMQGYGHECVWEDYVESSFDFETAIKHDNRNKEFLRVDRLIKQGILQRG